MTRAQLTLSQWHFNGATYHGGMTDNDVIVALVCSFATSPIHIIVMIPVDGAIQLCSP